MTFKQIIKHQGRSEGVKGHVASPLADWGGGHLWLLISLVFHSLENLKLRPVK